MPERVMMFERVKALLATVLGWLAMALVVGTCSYGSHHARAVHGVDGGVWDDTIAAFYYAGESVISDHGPRVEGVRIGVSETQLRTQWGAPVSSQPDRDGKTTHLFWRTGRDDELVIVSVQGGRTALVGRVGAEALTSRTSSAVDSQDTTSASPSAPWPPLLTSEMDIISRITGKAVQEELTVSDLEELEAVFRTYIKRVERQSSPKEVDAFMATMTATQDYEAELAECTLLSIDGGRVVRSDRFVELSSLMLRSKLKREDQLATDLRAMASAATREPWTDARGELCHPITREDVLAEMKRSELKARNFAAIGTVFRRVALAK